MRLPRSPDRTTTSAVITLVRLATGRGLYCRRPHSCLPVVPSASSAAYGAIDRGGRLALAHAGLVTGPATTAAARTARQPAAATDLRTRRDRGMALLAGIWHSWTQGNAAGHYQPAGSGIPSVYPAAL